MRLVNKSIKTSSSPAGGFVNNSIKSATWLAFKGSQLAGGANSIRLFLGVGVLGGFTTFSAFSLETFQMIEKKTYGLAAGYIGASVILSILAVFIGLVIARKVFAL